MAQFVPRSFKCSSVHKTSIQTPNDECHMFNNVFKCSISNRFHVLSDHCDDDNSRHVPDIDPLSPLCDQTEKIDSLKPMSDVGIVLYETEQLHTERGKVISVIDMIPRVT